MLEINMTGADGRIIVRGPVIEIDAVRPEIKAGELRLLAFYGWRRRCNGR
jgi:hypothetical protein